MDKYFDKFGNQYHCDMRSCNANKNKSKNTKISVDK